MMPEKKSEEQGIKGGGSSVWQQDSLPFSNIKAVLPYNLLRRRDSIAEQSPCSKAVLFASTMPAQFQP
jgi:hypothetical protein